MPDQAADFAEALKHAGPKVVVASHENPDGDAIGSARAMQLVCRALGHDSVVYVPRAIVPREYEFIRPDQLGGELPSDLGERTLICVDCGNEGRLANDALLAGARDVLNLDHHADNTHFGSVNYVDGTSACATLLIYNVAQKLGVEITTDLATALYVGLVTDTGRFQYSNTTPQAFDVAAELVRAGVDVHEVYRQIYERVELKRLKLLARALENAQTFDGGSVILTHLTMEDFSAAEADSTAAEGIVDSLRSVEGVVLACMVRDLPEGAPFKRKGSLRTSDESLDVSVIARTFTGGGHRQAAGFSTNDDIDAIASHVRQELSAQRNGTR
jgi:phosphoesterase RecJ-like protein